MIQAPEYREIMRVYGLDSTEILLLEDIKTFLLLFNSIQELLSSERTPTLAVTLPAYETCLETLSSKIAESEFPHLEHAIYPAVDKIQKYVNIARGSRVYGMSMCTPFICCFLSCSLMASASHQPKQ